MQAWRAPSLDRNSDSYFTKVRSPDQLEVGAGASIPMFDLQ